MTEEEKRVAQSMIESRRKLDEYQKGLLDGIAQGMAMEKENEE